jgi:hypothetical protein
MADSLKELIITLKVDGTQQARAALDAVDKAMGSTAKSAKDMDQSVGKAGQGLTAFGVFVANIAANAVTALARGMANLGFNIAENIITEAAEAELIMKKLTAAILTAGYSVEDILPDIEALADEIATTTKFTDDEVKGLAAYALSLGATKDQLKDIIQVSTDFATVQKVDLQSAVQGFTKSLQGNIRPLKQLFPALKDMSEGAAKAGGAIDFVRGKMGGAAAAEIDSFSGQMIQLKKNFADIYETLGMPIINYLGPLLKDINALIRPYTGSEILTKFSQGFVDAIEKIAVYMYDFYLFMTGGKSWLGLLLKIDANAPIFVKLTETFKTFFLYLARKTGEWAIPIGIEIGKGILLGFLSTISEIQKSIADAMPKWFLPKYILEQYGNIGSKAVEKMAPSFNLPTIQSKEYLDPNVQRYFPPPQETIPVEMMQQSQQSRAPQGNSNINQDIKMYVTGETAVDALSRQLKSAMNTFKTNVVA